MRIFGELFSFKGVDLDYSSPDIFFQIFVWFNDFLSVARASQN